MRIEARLDPLMSVAEMTAADAAAPDFCMPSTTLMENAGRAVADEIGRHFTPRPIAVLCGPGNNGGDGYVTARILQSRGWPVWCEALADPANLRGDAGSAFQLWTGETRPLGTDFTAADLYVDALFGVGLSRPLQGAAASLAAHSASCRDRIVSIDVPSGISGDTGLALGGTAFQAGLTVTFVRRKPGHCLVPGRFHAGHLVCAGIAMPREAIPPSGSIFVLSGGAVRQPNPAAHKYDRGHCLVVSGGAETSGAARLSALGAARAGAGLTTIAANPAAASIHASHLTAIMVRVFNETTGLAGILNDTRKNALVIGPGLGLDDKAMALLNAVLETGRPTILDADALTLIGRNTGQAILPIHTSCVLTPHGGEFARLFPDIAAELPGIGKVTACRLAAQRAGCTVLLKGADTVIAHPDGRAVIDALSPPWLATAGSGDVLAGFIGGSMAQGLSAFEAACAGVFLQGAAARHLGPGLLADDLPDAVPAILASLSGC